MKRFFRLLLTGMVTLALIQAIGLAAGREAGKESRIAIAEQYGLAYAPLQIMKERKLLEKTIPGLRVEWQQLNNTAAVREAMLAGRVDAGFIAIPPFLIGWDKGMAWKIAAGLSESPVGLVTWKREIRTLKDLSREDRIAVPQPGSVQHILLAMACEREFGDAKKLDNQLITLAHPDGMAALLARKEITAHFTAPPYLFKELEQPGMRQILDGNVAFGGAYTFIVGVTTAQFHDQNPRIYRAFLDALREAVAYIRNHPDQTAALLAAEYQIPEAELRRYLKQPGMVYTTEIKGLDQFAAFLKRNGYISRLPQSPAEIRWENGETRK